MDSIFQNVSILIVCFYVLTKSANYLVDGTVGIANIFKIPKIIIGIVLLSFATTAPEFAVTVISAIKGAPELALGNAVGSVIADDGIALAFAIFFSATVININKKIFMTSGLFLIAISILTYILSLDGLISRIEGVVILLILFSYLTFLVIMAIKNKNNPLDSNIEVDQEESEENILFHKQVFKFIVGLGGVLLSANLLVNAATGIAEIFKISDALIGQTIVAVGTSLPEIATCIVAARKGHADLAVGDIIGADILNLLWVIGAGSAISTLKVEKQTIIFAFPIMIAIVLFMILSPLIRKRFTKWHGAGLFAIYLLFLAGNIYFLVK